MEKGYLKTRDHLEFNHFQRLWHLLQSHGMTEACSVSGCGSFSVLPNEGPRPKTYFCYVLTLTSLIQEGCVWGGGWYRVPCYSLEIK